MALTALAPFVAGCDDFFTVDNPNVINAAAVDPVADGDLFARSAFQTLAAAYSGGYIVYSAWFTNEAWVGDTFPTRNEYGRRLVDDRNGTHEGVFFGIVRAIAQGEQVLEILAGGEGQDLNLARAAFTSGYGLLLQGEGFCEGTMRAAGGEPGPLMTPTQLLETAVNRLDQAIGFAGGSSASEAAGIANAARVAKGRALLQLGRDAEAAAAVAAVPDDFVFDAVYVDDPSNRGRLGNGVYSFSAGGGRESFVVPPHYRAMNDPNNADPDDPRIQWSDTGRNAQDGVLRFYSQRKYDNWAAAIRMASGLEARYIEAEVSANAAEVQAFINERRAVGGQDPIDSLDPAVLMQELFLQRDRDFWLEGKRLGDWRRHPNLVPNILAPGDNYYKPEVGTVSNQTCLPLPFGERNANPNIGS